MESRLVRDQSHRAFLALVFSTLTLGFAEPVLGQGSSPTPWSAGVEFMVANPPRLVSPALLGVSASRMILAGSSVGLRVELAAAHSLAASDLVCAAVPNAVCDARTFATIGALVASLTVGPAASDRSRGRVYGLVSAEAYGTLWSVGASGPGPSGLGLGAGLGVWMPGTSLPIRFETRYFRMDADGRFSLTAGFQYAW